MFPTKLPVKINEPKAPPTVPAALLNTEKEMLRFLHLTDKDHLKDHFSEMKRLHKETLGSLLECLKMYKEPLIAAKDCTITSFATKMLDKEKVLNETNKRRTQETVTAYHKLMQKINDLRSLQSYQELCVLVENDNKELRTCLYKSKQ